jgi:pre-mRNA-splicing factor SPF27
MPLIQSTASALPYIDAAPSVEALVATDALVQAEMASEDQSVLHPSIPTQTQPHFRDLIEAEHMRIAAGQPVDGGIDLSRYEALDAPAKGDIAAWKATLQKAYASTEYLRGREINLGLLETYGKNAWLIGNSQLEDILKYLEREVEASKLEQEAVEAQRKAAQANAAGEMQSLEEGWKTGIGRMIEAQAAAERLRQEILERKRMAAA